MILSGGDLENDREDKSESGEKSIEWWAQESKRLDGQTEVDRSWIRSNKSVSRIDRSDSVNEEDRLFAWSKRESLYENWSRRNEQTFLNDDSQMRKKGSFGLLSATRIRLSHDEVQAYRWLDSWNQDWVEWETILSGSGGRIGVCCAKDGLNEASAEQQSK